MKDQKLRMQDRGIIHLNGAYTHVVVTAMIGTESCYVKPVGKNSYFIVPQSEVRRVPKTAKFKRVEELTPGDYVWSHTYTFAGLGRHENGNPIVNFTNGRSYVETPGALVRVA